MDNKQFWNRYPNMPFNPRPFRTQPPGEEQAAVPASAIQAPFSPEQGAASDYTQQMEWLQRGSRAQRLEEKRLLLQQNFTFDGYQVVRRQYTSHNFDPSMTIRGTSITFNNACISKLEDAMYIHFLINVEEKRLVIRPVKEGDKDAVRWCILKEDKRKSRQITCKPFAEKLFEILGWDTVYRYKMQGVKINYLGEDMFLFDLTEVERFLPQVKDPVTGKVKRPAAELPEEWEGSFGMSVNEHEASTQVDLTKGFISPDELSPEEKEKNMYGTAAENAGNMEAL